MVLEVGVNCVRGLEDLEVRRDAAKSALAKCKRIGALPLPPAFQALLNSMAPAKESTSMAPAKESS